MSRPGPRIAWITGAGSGLGTALARGLAGAGYSVALSGRRVEPLARLANELGSRAAVLPCDVRSAEELERCRARIEADLGPVDLAVAAAGVARVGRMHQLRPDAVDESIDVNLRGTLQQFRAVLPGMLQRRAGVLVPILSVAARQVFPEWSVYCASKWGLLGFVEALRQELAGSGVRIVALTPGATDTPLWDDVAGEWDRRRMIPAEEVARALIWALESGDRATVEEIRLQPPGGNL